MATLFVMPKLGMTMEEGTIVKWFKKEGEPVKAGEVFLEVMTDKVNMEVEAPATGLLRKIIAPEGAVVPVNQPIAIIAEADEDISSLYAVDSGFSSSGAEQKPSAPLTSSAATGALPGIVKASPAARHTARQAEVNLAEVPGTGPGGRVLREDVEDFLKVRATPLARRIAAEASFPLEGIPGSGVSGRITRDDVLRVLPGYSAHGARVAGGPASLAREVTGENQARVESGRIPLTGIRKVVAERMSYSAHTAPHVTLTTEAVVDGLVALRSELAAEIEQATGIRLTYTDILVKAAARALTEFPEINATLRDGYIELLLQVNVGLAVAVEDGLMVPVIRDADRLNLGAIARAARDLAERARTRRLKPDELSGGTFTISNLGMYDIDAFTPIINPPETAILGIGRIRETPVVVDGQIVARPTMWLSLSFDHRIVDGAPAARFLKRVKDLIEKPSRMLA